MFIVVTVIIITVLITIIIVGSYKILSGISAAQRLALQASNVVLGSVINLAEGSECKRVESNMVITRILEGVGVGGNLHDES